MWTKHTSDHMRTDSITTSSTSSEDRNGHRTQALDGISHRLFGFGHPHSDTSSTTSNNHEMQPPGEDAIHETHPSTVHRLFGLGHLHSRTDSIPDNGTRSPSEDASTHHAVHRIVSFGHPHSAARTDGVRSSLGDQTHPIPSAVQTNNFQPSPAPRTTHVPTTVCTESLRSDSLDSGSPSQYTPSIARTESVRSSPTECGSLRSSITPVESFCASPTSSHRPNHRNVLIVGDVGVGKSSLVNLISDKSVATTSSGAKSCTLQSQTYPVVVDDVAFTLHDTAGLHEAQGHMGKKEYLDAVHQAYALISRLERSGGISLLVFCMKGGRVSITMQQTYNLFVEVFCNRQVPVVIVVTHLEMYDTMEHWWSENEKAIKEYGLRSHGHACITTTRGYREIFSDKYEQSKGIMRKLLLEYSGRVPWKEERANWVKRVVVHMRNWLSPRRAKHFKQLDGGDLRRKLTRRCGFSLEDANLVAEKIEQSRGIPQPREDSSWFDEKFGSNSTSSLSLPVVPYA